MLEKFTYIPNFLKIMETFSLKDMWRGWFVGDFEPSAYKTKNFEVAYGYHKKGDTWQKHYHKIATEINLITEGKVKVNDQIFSKGDIFILKPNEIVDPLFLEDTRFVVIKTISDANDKYIVE